jgi:hypothetical protein
VKTVCGGRRVACKIQLIAADTAASTEIVTVEHDGVSRALTTLSPKFF